MKEVKKMKKGLTLLLVLGMGILLVTGCQKAAETPATTQLSAPEAAGGVAMMTKLCLASDNGIVTGFTGASAMKVRAAAPSTPECTGGWWSSTDSYSSAAITYEASYQFRILDLSSNPVSTIAGLIALDDISKITEIDIASSFSYIVGGTSFSVNFGSGTANPLKFGGYDTSIKTISGPISLSETAHGENITISLNYSAINLSLTGYPSSGSVSFSITSNGSLVIAGNIVFDGDNTVTITFTSGVTGTYDVNIDTGVATLVP